MFKKLFDKSNKNEYHKAFTLAEVLITLVVIGVVAAITLPSIVASYNERAIIAKVKKNFSMFGQAMTFVKAEGGDMDMAVEDDNDIVLEAWFNEYLKPRLNTVKVCYNTPGCWNDGNTYAYSGAITNYNYKGKGIGNNTVIMVLADGTLMNIDAFNYSDMKNKLGIETNGSAGLVIFFDINGAREPNTLGKDIFVMTYVPGDGMVLPYRDRIADDCNKASQGYSCITKYLRKM